MTNTRYRCRLLLVPFVLSIACLAVCAQQTTSSQTPVKNLPVDQQEPPVVLKVTTRLVTVEVVARDRRGSPVRDLKADDFQLFEQSTRKTEQQIASFRLFDRTLSANRDPDRATLKIPPGIFTNLVTTKKLSAPPTILLVDGLNTDAASQLQARQKMVQLLSSTPVDIPVAVFLMGRRLHLLQSFTTDPKLLKEAAQRAMSSEANGLQIKDPRADDFSNTSLMEEMAGGAGQSGSPSPGSAGAANASSGAAAGSSGGNSDAFVAIKAALLQRFEKEQYAESVDARVRLTLDALRTIARHVSGYPGRKNLIWISSAFPFAIMPDQSATLAARFTGIRNYADELSGVASALTDAQIALYPVDPRGIETQAQFDPNARSRISSPFSEGAMLNRESDARFSDQQSMQDLAEQTGGQVCLNNNDLSQCVKRAIDDGSSYYELAYYPIDKNWHGEFRRIFVKTRRPGVRLTFRQGYFARASDATISATEAKDTDNRLTQAACNDFLSATSILVSAQALPADPGQAKYFLAVDPGALSFVSAETGARNLRLDLAACMFDQRGQPLQYFHQPVDQRFSESEYQKTRATGITHTLTLSPKPETARVRLLVCDSATGLIGSVDLPYPTETASAPLEQADTAGAPATSTSAAPASAPSSEAPHVIKFHDKAGHSGILEWNSEKISYSGDLSPEASARGMFDSLWAKSYACHGGQLVSVTDKATRAQQPLHFKAGGHGTDVHLDGASVSYSGDLIVDAAVKPFFEALRELYQCKSLAQN